MVNLTQSVCEKEIVVNARWICFSLLVPLHGLCASDRVEGCELLKKARKVLGPENFSGRFLSGVLFRWISQFSESVSQSANSTSHPSFWGWFLRFVV